MTRILQHKRMHSSLEWFQAIHLEALILVHKTPGQKVRAERLALDFKAQPSIKEKLGYEKAYFLPLANSRAAQLIWTVL